MNAMQPASRPLDMLWFLPTGGDGRYLGAPVLGLAQRAKPGGPSLLTGGGSFMTTNETAAAR